MSAFGINVLDFGAKGDGVTDDTAAIQSALNYAADRGGGRILFPYTPHGYRIASPGGMTSCARTGLPLISSIPGDAMPA